MKIVIGVPTAGLVLVLALGVSAQENETARAERGHELYRFYCASCHGSDGKGSGPVSAVLQPPPSDLTRIAARHGGVFPEQEIADYIDGRRDVAAHGPRQMPVWGRVLGRKVGGPESSEAAVAAEIQLIVGYLRTLQVAGASESEAPSQDPPDS